MIEGKNLLMNIHGWSRNVVVTTKVYATRSWYFYALGTGHVNKCVFSMPSHFQDLPRFAKIRQDSPRFAKAVAPTGVSGGEMF